MTALDKLQIKGQLVKSKFIQAKDAQLLYIQVLSKQNETINALLAKHGLEFLMDHQEGDPVTLYGHYNQKHQFVVEKYLSAQKGTSLYDPKQPKHLKYPHQKKSNLRRTYDSSSRQAKYRCKNE